MARQVNVPDPLLGDHKLRLQHGHKAGTEVPQHMPFNIRPYQLDRVQFRGVWRQKHQRQAFVELYERLGNFGPVNARIVHHHHDLPLDMAQEMLEEPVDVPLST